MTLREKQSLFVRLQGKWLSYVDGLGYELTMGDGLRRDGKGHMVGSLHYVALAKDWNLFVNGVWVSAGGTPYWKKIGEFWENLHPLCAWGGRFRDDNHISIRHGARAMPLRVPKRLEVAARRLPPREYRCLTDAGRRRMLRNARPPE